MNMNGGKLNNLIFRWLSFLFSFVYGKVAFQKIFKVLYYISMDGLHYGKVHNFQTDGERWLLKKIARELKLLTGPVTIIDAGANQGNYTDQVLEVFKDRPISLHLFEPGSRSFACLEEKFQGTDLKINHFGLGHSHQKVLLNIPNRETNCASIHRFTEDAEQEEIELFSLDEYCDRNAVTCIHLLKLDVEGHEYACLKGASGLLSDKKIKFIQFEFGENNINSRIFFRDIYDYLDGLGYEIFRLVKDGLVPVRKYHPSLEIFITTNYLARIKGHGK